MLFRTSCQKNQPTTMKRIKRETGPIYLRNCLTLLAAPPFAQAALRPSHPLLPTPLWPALHLQLAKWKLLQILGPLLAWGNQKADQPLKIGIQTSPLLVCKTETTRKPVATDSFENPWVSPAVRPQTPPSATRVVLHVRNGDGSFFVPLAGSKEAQVISPTACGTLVEPWWTPKLSAVEKKRGAFPPLWRAGFWVFPFFPFASQTEGCFQQSRAKQTVWGPGHPPEPGQNALAVRKAPEGQHETCGQGGGRAGGRRPACVRASAPASRGVFEMRVFRSRLA